MFCDNCRQKYTKGSIFCDNCGRSIGDNNESVPVSKSASVTIKLFNAKPSTAVVAFILVSIIVGGIFALSVFKKYQSKFNTTGQELIKIQEALENIQSSTTASFLALEEENKKLQKENKKLQVVVSIPPTPTKKESISSNSDALSQELLGQIMLRIVKVKCLRGNGVNEGSGVIQAPVDGSAQWNVYTNLHVIGLGNGTGVCYISLPQIPDYVPTVSYRATTERVAGQYPDIDFAVLKVRGTTEFFNEFPIPTCNVIDIKIGDRVTVFG